jgi:hypothetical protein
MHSFKHCGEENCIIIGNIILPQSYCDLCTGNGCRSAREKCCKQKLILKFTSLKTDLEYNYKRAINRKRSFEE